MAKILIDKTQGNKRHVTGTSLCKYCDEFLFPHGKIINFDTDHNAARMPNGSWKCGICLRAITTPNSLKVKDKEIYYVHSETRPGTKYQVNFEDGTCTCADFKNRGETCKHFYRIVFEKSIE